MVTSAPAPVSIDFQGRDAGEMFQFYFRKPWIRLVPCLLSMFLWSALLLAVAYVFFVGVHIAEPLSRRVLLLVFVAAFAIVQWEFLIRFYAYFLHLIIVTDRKVHRIKKTLFVTDEHQSLDLWMFQDMHKRQHGLIQNFLGYGTIVLEAQDTELRIHFTPHVARMYDRLLHIRERAREQMAGSPQQPMAPSPRMAKELWVG